MPSTFPERKSDWNSPTAPTSSVYQMRSADWNGMIDHTDGWVNVKSYGAVGDGVADDTVALESALATGKTVIVPADCTIRWATARPAFLTAATSIVGLNKKTSVIKIDTDLRNFDATYRYWINAGIPSKGGTPSIWRGSIRNLTLSSSSTAFLNYAIFLHAAENFAIEDVIFDWTAIPGGSNQAITSVEGFNNAGWNSLSNWRKRGSISRNRILADQRGDASAYGVGGGEAYGINYGDSIIFDSNFATGVGDDQIGIHFSTNIKVTNNEFRTVHGRIYMSQSTNVLVDNNRIERIADGAGTYINGGSMIHASLEGTDDPAPTRLTITNNTAIIPSGVTSGTYGIRLMGVRDTIVSKNIVQNDASANTASGLSLEYDTSNGSWTDPTGLDPTGRAQPRRVSISDNRMSGTYPQNITQSGTAAYLVGPIDYAGNVAAGYTIYATAGTRFAHTNKTLAADGAGLDVSTVDGPPLFSAAVIGVASGLTKDGGIGGATLAKSWKPQRAGRIAYVKAHFSAAPDTGYIDLAILKNGSGVGSGQGVTTQFYSWDMYSVSAATFAAGDTLMVRAIGVSPMLNTVDGCVEVYGLYD